MEKSGKQTKILDEAEKRERERMRKIVQKRKDKAMGVLKQVVAQHGIGGPMDSEWKGRLGECDSILSALDEGKV